MGRSWFGNQCLNKFKVSGEKNPTCVHARTYDGVIENRLHRKRQRRVKKYENPSATNRACSRVARQYLNALIYSLRVAAHRFYILLTNAIAIDRFVQ